MNDGQPVKRKSFRVKLFTFTGPETVGGVSVQDPDGFTILINENRRQAAQLAAFLHEMTHIYNGDHESGEDPEQAKEKQSEAGGAVRQKSDKAAALDHITTAHQRGHTWTN